MFDWIVNLYDQFASIISGLVLSMFDFYNSINDLSNNVEQITNGNGGINKYLGAFRFVVGDLIYLSYYFIALFGCMYTLYVLINGVIKTLANAKLNAFKYIKPS